MWVLVCVCVLGERGKVGKVAKHSHLFVPEALLGQLAAVLCR